MTKKESDLGYSDDYLIRILQELLVDIYNSYFEEDLDAITFSQDIEVYQLAEGEFKGCVYCKKTDVYEEFRYRLRLKEIRRLRQDDYEGYLKELGFDSTINIKKERFGNKQGVALIFDPVALSQLGVDSTKIDMPKTQETEETKETKETKDTTEEEKKEKDIIIPSTPHSEIVHAVNLQKIEDYFHSASDKGFISVIGFLAFIKSVLRKKDSKKYLSDLKAQGFIIEHSGKGLTFTEEAIVSKNEKGKQTKKTVKKEKNLEKVEMGDTDVSPKRKETTETLEGKIKDTKPLSKRNGQDYICIQTLEELEEVVSLLCTNKEIAIDMETTSLDLSTLELVGISLCADPGKAYYIPIAHKIIFSLEENKPLNNLPKKETLDLLSQKILINPNIKKVGQNIKFDLKVLHKEGIDISPISFDTMLASYVINSNNTKTLEVLAKRYCHYEMQSITELIGKGPNQKSFADVPIKKATFYSCEDADYTLQIAHILKKKLNEENYKDVFSKIEMPLIEVLANMEETGVKIDVDHFKKLTEQIEVRLIEIIQGIYNIAGEQFNINSTKELQEIFFKKLKFPIVKKTKEGQPSTDVEVLKELANTYELPKLLLDYRELMKLKTTYLEALPKLADSTTSRIHTSFNQANIVTGRISSSNPNLQNIPKKSQFGNEIRKAFIAKEGYKILTADYSQMELSS